MNPLKNEHPVLNLETLPALQLYKPDSNEPVTMNKDFSLDSLVEFLQKEESELMSKILKTEEL